MASQIPLVQAGGTALAIGASGIALPHRADTAEAGSGARLLPPFGRPTRLDVADVSALGGDDQLPLTTLQGVVNRRRPRLYFWRSASARGRRNWSPAPHPSGGGGAPSHRRGPPGGR
ncbi:GxGYxYP domain-containing protein [Streptomyces sp. NPDC049944]|uniref:GxGYxYP domain-containing protein n=1 Tax=Streptomyces sp. NPDC049944 TaxID=3155657 RepID=UPI003438CE7A